MIRRLVLNILILCQFGLAGMVFGQQQSSDFAHQFVYHSDQKHPATHVNEIDTNGVTQAESHEHTISLHLKDMGNSIAFPLIKRQPALQIGALTPPKLIGLHAQIYRPPR